MRVLVTGGTGYVGAHTVAALFAVGHDVRLLVRRPDRVAPALAPLGVDPAAIEVVVGDVRDHDAVIRAVHGMDAVINAANVYSLNAARGELMWQVNTGGTRTVLAAAAERGLDPIVHVSSVAALIPAQRFTPAMDPGRPRGPYCRSKAEAERIALALRAEGAPVVLTNPGAVYGPHDPHVGESATIVRNMLVGRLPATATGGFGVVDVRDVAAAHTRILEREVRPRRYLMAGTWLSSEAYRQILRRVTGRRLPALTLGERSVRAAARLGAASQRYLHLDLGLSLDTLELLGQPRWEGPELPDVFGVAWRSPEASIRDTIAWLYATGRLSARQAGLAAAPAEPRRPTAA
jgi:dihydroflavonol-4-reductase